MDYQDQNNLSQSVQNENSTASGPAPFSTVTLNEQMQQPNVSESSGNNKIILFVGLGVLIIILIGSVGYYIFRQAGISTGNSENENSKSALLGNVNSACDEACGKIMDANAFDFEANCGLSNMRTGELSQEAVKEKTSEMVLIFDSSGSMAATINGKRKIDIAKDAAKGFIDKVAGDKNFSLSIVAYGHKGGNSQAQKAQSCAGIEEVYYLGVVNADIAKKKLDNFDAVGWTPITSSIQKASEILQKNNADKKFILLVSDGEETCGGDPVTAVKNLKSLNITANVIGFDVAGKDEEQLKNIANAGGGEYLSAKNSQDLEQMFEKHKQTLNVANFKIGRIFEQIYDISSAISTYNNCSAMLKMQEASIMLDIYDSKLAGEKCEARCDQQYRVKYEEVKEKIEKNFENDKLLFDKLK